MTYGAGYNNNIIMNSCVPTLTEAMMFKYVPCEAGTVLIITATHTSIIKYAINVHTDG